MLSRYFISFNFAAVITFGLFFAMQMLISQGDMVLQDTAKRHKIVFGKMPEVLDIKKEIEQPVLDEIEQAPIIDKMIIKDKGDVGPVITGFRPEVGPDIDTPTKIGGLFTTDGDFIVLARPDPIYPSALAEKGIEGFVRVKYTITKLGNTTDVIAVSSSNRGFEKSAVKAAEKFKFKPKIEDGEAIAVSNVYNLIEFKLES